MPSILSLALALFLISGAGQALAEDHQIPMHQAAAEHAFNQEYLRAMDNMHRPMMEGIMDSDPDAAFVRGMIPHHKGAVEMAEIQLKYGKDPELKKMAQDIIAAQNKEIEFMEKWLKERRRVGK